MYAAAGVVLNDHWDDMRADGFVSNRLFDAAACGARVVTDDVAGLDGLFGASVQVVHDADELAALVRSDDRDRVFGTREERRVVADRVRREHSFLHRAQRLLDVALEVRARQAACR
jgi:spore maturation protein CgeB